MQASIVSRSEKKFKIEVEVAYSHNMLEGEEGLQRSLNEAGLVATRELLGQFDTDGSPIVVAGVKLTAKSEKESKEFQTPYGPVCADRYVYQTSVGGKTYVPLDIASRIVGTSTPKFAKMVSSKYACDGAPGVQRDLAENHNRPVALSFIKNISDTVGAIAVAKEEDWTYQIPDMPKAVGAISVGLDGTCLNMMDEGWREAMCGTISLYDRKGERMHTIYTAASPEYGKETFLSKFGESVDNIISLFPKTPVVGLADGAASNWSFLTEKADILTIDFWHYTEYLAKAANAMFPGKNQLESKETWLENACHNSKHKMGAVSRILTELTTFSSEHKLSGKRKSDLSSAITYLQNHKEKMLYYKNTDSNMPIGSGVTEAACKSLVKVRMCKGAARWKDEGATVVLTLRSLHMTNERWGQFWKKYAQYGYNEAA
jgi:hypothetical protein